MNAHPQRYERFVSCEEYYEILATGETKYEWFNGMMWPVGNPDNLPRLMAGAQANHNQIKNNVETRLTNQLDETPCFVRSSDQQIKVEESGLRAFPDVLVACEDAFYDEVNGLETLTNPIVLVEILSPSTAQFDLTDKWAHYRLIPSLRDYLVIFSDQMRVQHYGRSNQSSTWEDRFFVKSDDEIQLFGVSCRLVVGDIYKRVQFPSEPTTRTPRLI